MPGIIGPYSNWKPENDPYLKRHLPQKVEGAPDFMKGILSGVAGLPSDVMQMLAQGSESGPPHQGNPNAMRQRTMPALPVPLTSEHLGKIMGADTSSSGFMAGQIGAPDPKDLMKILAGNKLAMTLFHGGPHKFDKFDLAKIGTGEGAQAYGHGLYFAENPSVAKAYTQAGDIGWEIDGVGYSSSTTKLAASPHDYAANALDRFGGDKKEAIKWLDASLPFESDAIDILKNAKTIKKIDGHLYEVDIPDDVTAKMLDWDAPLSEQPESVRKALQDADLPILLRFKFGDRVKMDTATGKEIYEAMTMRVPDRYSLKEKQESASSALQRMGIPGIRYLDAGSRSAKDGTRNIVLFDTDTIREVKRDGERVYENKLGIPKQDYKIAHRPMQVSGGASRLDDLTSSFGEDVYGPNATQFFGSGDAREKRVLAMMKKFRGQPDAEITIYRGVPGSAADAINSGDWITIDEGVAKDYAALEKGGKVISKKVKVKDITSWPDSLLEFGYYPDE
jgi:hypothetical protein